MYQESLIARNDYETSDYLEDVLPTRKNKNKNKNKQHLIKATASKSEFTPKLIEPKTNAQSIAMEQYGNGKNLVLSGFAGTGKTFLALGFALQSVMVLKEQKQVILIRSVVPSRDIGFLPGNTKEKAKTYEAPYYGICNSLFGRADAYDVLKNKMIIDFQTTSFLRGMTFDDVVLVVDEIQNMTDQELHTILTRVGENTRIILSGDYRQSDLTNKETSGIIKTLDILKRMKHFACVDFKAEDCIRSSFVKDYLIQKEIYESSKQVGAIKKPSEHTL